MTINNQLQGEVSRQAVAPIRGYVYQVYQSLYAWIQLKPDQILLLEGAEDFDVYGERQVTTNQVKNVTSSVTLHSQSAIDAISHFWSYANENPERKVYFRFLTTADAGQEAKNPFGDKIKGIELWPRIKKTDSENIVLIKNFLLSLDLPETLKKFLQENPSGTIYEHLIEPISWNIGQKSIDGIESSIKEKLIDHGLNKLTGVPAHDSVRAVDHLLKVVWGKIIQSKDRTLTFCEFALAFEVAIGSFQTHAEKYALINAAFQRGLLASEGVEARSNTSSNFPILTPIPRVVADALNRTQILEKLGKILAQSYAVIICGSTCIGKTTLAKQLAFMDGENWLWASFRGCDSRMVKDRLRQAAVLINNSEFVPRIVLDDIDLSADFFALEPELQFLAFIIEHRRGSLIITTQASPPKQFFLKLSLPEGCEFKTPLFSLDEIAELIKLHGIQDASKAEGWAKVVLLSTDGHPLLVHARIRNLQAQGWKRQTAEELLLPKDVEQEKEDMLRRLMSELPEKPTRTFVYRLSINIRNFTYSTAMLLANIPQAISLPGEEFKRLLGPWIEQLSENEYRVSPLLNGAAAKNLSLEEICALHEAVAASLLNKKTVDISEVSDALMHALLGKAEYMLFKLAYNLFQMPYEYRQNAAKHLSWFLGVGAEENQEIFPTNPHINVLLRGVQFQVAANLDQPEDAIRIANRWLSATEIKNGEELMVVSRFFALGAILINYKVPFRPGFVVEKLLELSHLRELCSKIDLSKIAEDLPFLTSAQVSDLVSVEIARITNLAFFNEYFDVLNSLSDQQRNIFLMPFEEDDLHAAVLFNQVWTRGVDQNKDDPRPYIESFRNGSACAKLWGCKKLYIAAQVALSVIYDEYMNDPDAAISCINEAEKQAASDSAPLQNQRAKVLYRQGKHNNALEIWDQLIEKWHVQGEVEPAFAARSAGIAAAKIGDWKKAQHYFDLGKGRAQTGTLHESMAIGFAADSAFALWKQNKKPEALKGFMFVLEAVMKIEIRDDLKNRALFARFGHTLSWSVNQLTGKSDEAHAEPPPGCMSNQEKDDNFKDYEPRPTALLWYLLSQIERILNLKCGILEKSVNYTKKSPSLYAQVVSATEELELAFVKKDFEFLVELYLRFRAGLKVSGFPDKKNDEIDILKLGNVDELSHDEKKSQKILSGILPFFIAALISLSDDPKKEKTVCAKWRKAIQSNNMMMGDVSVFFDSVNLDSDYNHCMSCINDDDQPTFKRAIFALKLLKRHPIAPEDMFRAHFVLWNYLLVSCPNRWGGKDIERMVVKGWLYAAKHQKSCMVSPRVNVSNILDECNDSQIFGLTKVAGILLAAAPAVKVRLDPSAREFLQKTKEKSPP